MINVLSLFDGLGGARIALDQLGIECTYYASEVDKYAIKVAMANYPDIIQLGDVVSANSADLPKIDLLIGGSPCQDLSVAKSGREGLEGSRSGLFWEYVRLLRELKPRYFLLENVYSMKASDRDIISKEMGCSPMMINSAEVTAQSRKRNYWHNTEIFMQPINLGILLKDIIEEDADITGIYTVPRGFNKGGIRIADKAPAVTSNAYIHNNKLVINPVKIGHLGQNKRQDRVYSIYGKSVTLCGNGGGQGAKTGLYYFGGTQCCTKDFDEYIGCGELGCSVCGYFDITKAGDYIRKLTPLECERLQGIPEGYTDYVSNTQRYKMIGNGFTIPVIMHILKGMKI